MCAGHVACSWGIALFLPACSCAVHPSAPAPLSSSCPETVNRASVFDTLVNNLEGMAYRCLLDPQWTMVFVSQESHTTLEALEHADLRYRHIFEHASEGIFRTRRNLTFCATRAATSSRAICCRARCPRRSRRCCCGRAAGSSPWLGSDRGSVWRNTSYHNCRADHGLVLRTVLWRLFTLGMGEIHISSVSPRLSILFKRFP